MEINKEFIYKLLGCYRDSGARTPTTAMKAQRAAPDQKSSGRFTTMGSDVLRTTTHRNGTSLDGLISWCGSQAGT